jgi:hypothetical protein
MQSFANLTPPQSRGFPHPVALCVWTLWTFPSIQSIPYIKRSLYRYFIWVRWGYHEPETSKKKLMTSVMTWRNAPYSFISFPIQTRLKNRIETGGWYIWFIKVSNLVNNACVICQFFLRTIESWYKSRIYYFYYTFLQKRIVCPLSLECSQYKLMPV